MALDDAIRSGVNAASRTFRRSLPLADFHVLAKPSGSTCNIDCTYCFFLSKESLYPDARQRMSDATLEAYLSQLIASCSGPEVKVAWQGGEPTLMTLAFFRHALALLEKYKRPGQIVEHAFQTNGLLIDDEWCSFFKEHRFLVGLSVDGPREMHDRFRVDRRGQGTFHLVMRALECLRRHDVEFNILCAIHDANQDHGRAVYQFFRDELGARFIQFIPIVERSSTQTLDVANKGWREAAGDKRIFYAQTGDQVTRRSVGPRAYGQFLIDVFEEWVRHDVGQVYVQLFDVTLSAYFATYTLCDHAPSCGNNAALQFNGDLYSCDHYVEPSYRLGNIHDKPMGELMASEQQREFGLAKKNRLTQQCRHCEVLPLCHGGCPKDRFTLSSDGEPGHNYLCEGLKLFFTHTQVAMQSMAGLIERHRPPALVMAAIAAEDRRRGPDAPCPCGSGKELRICHGSPVSS